MVKFVMAAGLLLCLVATAGKMHVGAERQRFYVRTGDRPTMMLRTRCPHCSRTYSLPASTRGQRAKCRCGNYFPVEEMVAEVSSLAMGSGLGGGIGGGGFGRSAAPQFARLPMRLVDERHPARSAIEEAGRYADENVELALADGRVLCGLKPDMADGLVETIERALRDAPNDPDLLVARAATFACEGREELAQRSLDEAVRAASEHFEAKMCKRFGERWPHVFSYPSWSDAHIDLPPALAGQVGSQRVLHLVRDTLQVGLAIVIPARRSAFPRVGAYTPSRFEAQLAETPLGAIVAHFTSIADNTTDPYRYESFLNVAAPEEPDPASGYWLVQRLANLESCFIVLADRERGEAFYNRRYIFPDELRNSLRQIATRLASKPPRMDVAAFKKACLWYQENLATTGI